MTVLYHPERFIAGGEAIARDPDGKVVFIRGGVPGDTVEAEITEESAGWSRAIVSRVVEPGTDRAEPPCVAFRRGCGGCDWQFVRPETQLAHKTAIVVDALRRTARMPDADVTTGTSVPASAYRTTVRVVPDADGRPGFRSARSHDVVGFGTCDVADPRLNEVLANVTIDPDVSLTVRVSVATGEATARWDTAAGDVRGLPDWVGLGADASLTERVTGCDLRVSAGSFFQSGPAAADLLVDAVGRASPELADATRVVDAYAGVGMLGLATTGPDTTVITVESSRSSHADSVVNFEGRPAHHDLAEVARWSPPAGEPIDVVIADPARSGLGKPGVAALSAVTAPVLVLVSCDPAALARDTRLLIERGFQHRGTEVLDLFPMTHHVEAVTRFVRA